MSITRNGQQVSLAEHACRVWANIFASGIEHARLAAGLSIDQAARLAGMAVSEWMALEAGALLPPTEEQLRAIAGALEMDFDRLAGWVLLCWSAWE